MTAAPPARAAGGRGARVAIVGPLALACAGPLLAEEAARPRTVIEEMVAATNPCASLRTELGGQVIGLDTLADVELRTADASLAGDAVSLALDGRLTCRTPDGALLAGDAASDFAATATLSLVDCAAAEVHVTLSDFGGSFAGILATLRPAIEAELAEAARREIVSGCESLGQK